MYVTTINEKRGHEFEKEQAGRIWRKKRKGMAADPEVKLMGKVKQIKAPALAWRSIPSKMMVQVRTTRKK